MIHQKSWFDTHLGFKFTLIVVKELNAKPNAYLEKTGTV